MPTVRNVRHPVEPLHAVGVSADHVPKNDAGRPGIDGVWLLGCCGSDPSGIHDRDVDGSRRPQGLPRGRPARGGRGGGAVGSGWRRDRVSPGGAAGRTGGMCADRSDGVGVPQRPGRRLPRHPRRPPAGGLCLPARAQPRLARSAAPVSRPAATPAQTIAAALAERAGAADGAGRHLSGDPAAVVRHAARPRGPGEPAGLRVSTPGTPGPAHGHRHLHGFRPAAARCAAGNASGRRTGAELLPVLPRTATLPVHPSLRPLVARGGPVARRSTADEFRDPLQRGRRGAAATRGASSRARLAEEGLLLRLGRAADRGRLRATGPAGAAHSSDRATGGDHGAVQWQPAAGVGPLHL